MSSPLFDLVPLLISILALIGALPSLASFVVYHFYKPEFWVHIGQFEENESLPWHNLTTEAGSEGSQPLNIISRSQVDLEVNIEFHIDTLWPPLEGQQSRIEEFSLGGENTYRAQLQSFLIPAGGTLAPTFPLKPDSENCELIVIVYPTVHLSEFDIPFLGIQIPRYFGEADLKPTQATFHIVED